MQKTDPKQTCDVVIDLETLGRKPGCPVLEVGVALVQANGTGYGRAFFPNLREQIDLMGAKPDAETIMWWMSPALTRARDRQVEEFERSGSYATATILMRLNSFVVEHRGSRDLRVWGNGASFDLGILKELYDCASVKPFWEFWEERDLRTLVDLAGGKPDVGENDLPHSGVADAIHELEILRRVLGIAWTPQE